jgi:isocitrate dehydrogenase
MGNRIIVPTEGERISVHNGKLRVPDAVILPFVEGDGSGRDIWRASRRVLDAAVEKAYKGNRKLVWIEVYAGEKAFNKFGTWLPDETVDAFRDFIVGIKGPLTTPLDGGNRSLNVALRKLLDLYVCQRPVRYFNGVPSPVRHPEYVDMVVFRENTEDIYTGIEFEYGTHQNDEFKRLFKEQFPSEYKKIRFPETAGLGIKPVSKEGTSRLVRAAIRFALQNKRRSVTLVHKGNIIKYTEGSFRSGATRLAESEFGKHVYTWSQWGARSSSRRRRCQRRAGRSSQGR